MARAALMLWCLRCVLRRVLSFKMGFWMCGSGGVRDVHVLICTRVVQIGVALCNVLRATKQKKQAAPNPLIPTLVLIWYELPTKNVFT